MAQPEQLDWAHLLGSPFALAVAPFLSRRELFALSACSRKVLQLRYDLCSWDVRLDNSYWIFRTKRHLRPPCFKGRVSFDLVTYLGSRLSVRMSNPFHIENVDALAGVHTLDLNGCLRITDVGALGGVHILNLSRCDSITDVSALGGVHTLNLSDCQGISDVGALGGVHTLDLSDCKGIRNVSALGGVHTLDLSGCKGIRDVSALRGVHSLTLPGKEPEEEDEEETEEESEEESEDEGEGVWQEEPEVLEQGFYGEFNYQYKY